jgi:predicted permease
MMLTFASDVAQDLRYGLRLIRRTPGLSAIAIGTVAVAIASNTAIFSLVNALFFKPVGIADAGRVVRVYPGESGMSLPNLVDVRERSTTFADLVAQRSVTAALMSGQAPTRVRAGIVTSNYFSTLGVAALTGRPFLPSDVRTDLVVLGETFWRTRFAADAAILGKTIALDGRQSEVIGVMPRSFRGLVPPGFAFDVWLPIDSREREGRVVKDRSAAQFEVFGRLKPSIDAEAAAAETRLLMQALATEHPEVSLRASATEVFAVTGVGLFRGLGKTLLPVFAFLALLTIIAGCVLLIGCANVAGLLIGRAVSRRRELAVRLAIGAGRGRVIRQLVTESAVLAIVGGVAGMVLTLWITAFLPTLLGRLPFQLDLDIGLDRRVLAYAVVLTACAALLSGLVPARRASRTVVLTALKDESGGPGPHRLRHALVIGQVLLCSMLLAWSLLFARSLRNIANVDPGFDSSQVLIANLSLDDSQTNRSAAILDDIQNRAAALPGVDSTGMVFALPLSLYGRQEYGVQRADAGASPEALRVMGNTVTPGYFATLRIPLKAGRDFTSRDDERSPGVLIVNETAARRFWNGDAIGRSVRVPKRDEMVEVEVVGVVRDSKYWTLGEAIAPTFYLPLQQSPIRDMTLVVRTRDLGATAASLKHELLVLAPTAAGDVKLMTEAVSVAVLPAQIGAVLTTALGVIAVLMAAVGIYGLVSFTVAQRMREIGIRKAVGAQTRDVVKFVLTGSLFRVGAGLAGGLLLGGLAARAFSGFVVGVSTFDAVSSATVAVVVMTSAAVASVIPTLRATRVDPIVTLRAE